MSDINPNDFVVDIEGVGKVHQLRGTGPWHVREHGQHSFDIRDSLEANANPTMTVRPPKLDRGWKTNENVVFAKREDAEKVVQAFNDRFAAAAENQAAGNAA